MNSNFEFSTPATAKFGPEKPTFTSVSSLSKPRFAKSRKSYNPRSAIDSSETRSGFNPFRSGLENPSRVSSRVENDEVGHGSFLNRNKDFEVKVTNKVEKVANALVDEIRRLRIENHGDGCNVGDQSGNNLHEGSKSSSGVRVTSNTFEEDLPCFVNDDMKKLNLGGSSSRRCSLDSIRGAGFGSRGSHNGGNMFGTSLASELPNSFKNLNIKDRNEVGTQSVVFGAPGNDFVFGNSRKNDEKIVSGITTVGKKSNAMQKEMKANKSEKIFVSGHCRTVAGNDQLVDPMILDEIEKLKIGDGASDGSSGHSNLSNPSSLKKEPYGSVKPRGKVNHTGSTSIFGEVGLHQSGPTFPIDQKNEERKLHKVPASSKSSNPFTGLQFAQVVHEFQGPYVDAAEKKPVFDFSSKLDGQVEFRTPNPKGNLFSDSNRKIEFSAKKKSGKNNLPKGRKGKLKEPSSILFVGKSFPPKENCFQPDFDPSESFSPMDVSPYHEIQDETSSTSQNKVSTSPSVSYSNNRINEDVVSATECMDINNENDVKHDDTAYSEGSINSTAGSHQNPMSVTDTASFKSAFESFGRNEKSEVESDGEVQSSQCEYFSASSSVRSGGSSFAFSASSSERGQSSIPTRPHRKKSHSKACPEIHNFSRNARVSDATSSLHFSPTPGVSEPPLQVRQKSSFSTAGQKEGANFSVFYSRSKNVGNIIEDKKGESTPAVSFRAAQEACEKWRIRGNQAYSSGDLEKAEDYYTQGLSCIPQGETSRDCLRALLLCYSNRAATRMSLGKMKDALRDCLVAADIDPNFFRVQLRAANCYLALGEVGDASRYFRKLVQSPDVCVDRKLILEASEGMQKSQKVSECMNRSAEALLQRTLTDLESVLGVIEEALLISPYSEQLLEHKAEVLFMLRRYEEVIKLCEQTLEAAGKNFPLSETDGKTSSMEDSEIMMNCSFIIWRYSLISKSYFYLGKLEEALDYLDKQEQWKSMVNKYGNDALEPLIPHLSTARELIRLKTVGNEAFQAGRHTEAVEHYNAALSFNVESRPFMAVCFCNRAAAHQALGQIADAIADCSLAIALDENYLKAISRKATLFEMIRDYEQAAKDLERLVSLLNTQADQANQSGASLPLNSLADLRQARKRLHQMEEQTMKGLPLNFYLILGVEPSVSAADLKKAYRKAALKHHPDKAGQFLARSESRDDGSWRGIAEEVRKDADKLFKMIGEAYAVLSDLTKRSQYDIEEEMRNGQRKSNPSSMPRTHTDPLYTAERSGSGWPGRSSANPYYRGFEPSRFNRFQ